MKNISKRFAALLLAAVICLGLGACGTGDGDQLVDGTLIPSLPSTVSVKTGTIATDSWGYTGSTPVQVAAPSQAEILISGRTLLMDDSLRVVSGNIPTKISFSSDRTTLSRAAQAYIPADCIAYLDISMGSAKSAFPELSVTVDVGVAAAGTTLTLRNYDVATGKWIAAQTTVVSSTGKITFPAKQLSLWGIFR